MSVTDLAVGTAAEHLVCADLLLLGYRAFLADQNCPYDVAVEHNAKLIRVQVKSTRAPKFVANRPGSANTYQWHVRRCGRAGRRSYADGEFDVIALVAIDCRQIAYFKPREILGGIMHLRPPGVTSDHGNSKHHSIDCYPFVAVADDAE